MAQVSERSDSVRVERRTEYVELWRDTTVYVTMPTESAMVVRPDSSLLRTSLAESAARIEPDGSLFHTLRNLPGRIAADVRVRDTRTSQRSDSVLIQYRDRTITVRERYIPAFYKFCTWALILIVLATCTRLWLRRGRV